MDTVIEARKARRHEKMLGYYRTYRAKHREERNAYTRKYHDDHPEKFREYNRKYYATHSEECNKKIRIYLMKHPERKRAKEAVCQAIKMGRLVRSPCEVCGKKADAHHDDYSKPLDVRWLCRPHHQQWHYAHRKEVENVQNRRTQKA